MKNIHRLLATGLVAVAVAAYAAPAQAGDLPAAEKILDRYVEVTGGEAAHRKIQNSVSKGTLEIVGAGIKGTMTSYHAAPNMTYVEIDFPGMGKSEDGCDGQVAWERSAMTGPRIKEGDEAAMAMRLARLHADLEWRKLFEKVKTTGVEEVDGREAYVVELTSKENKPETRYFDKETGLVVMTKMVVPTQMGPITLEAMISDYRETDGIKSPHQVLQKTSFQQMRINIESVEYNVELPEDRFDLPAEVKALRDKPKSKSRRPAGIS